MERRSTTQAFNKEKLFFLLAGMVFAGGLYYFLASAPVPLVASYPMSGESAPTPLPNVNPDEPREEAFYVVDGKITGLIDMRTRQLVNRERKTPFIEAAKFLADRTKPKEQPKELLVPPPPPPPPPPLPGKNDRADGKKRSEFHATDAESAVEFVGVVTMGGRTYGMLRPKDGGKVMRVQVGDVLPGCDYTVTKIEKQGIWVTDEEKRPFNLRDLRYADMGVSTDTPKSDSEDPDAALLAEKTPKKEEKPAPKAPAPKAPAPQNNPGGKDNGAKGGRGKLQSKMEQAMKNGLDPKLIEALKARLNGAGAQ
jgi:type IV pilus biogenesis protein PilP